MSRKGFLIGWLLMAVVIEVYKGSTRQSRTYTTSDAVFGVIEGAFLIWLAAGI